MGQRRCPRDRRSADAERRPSPSGSPLCTKVSNEVKPKGWQCRCDELDSQLDFTNMGLTEFTKTTLVGCGQITYLFLDHNQITEIAEGTFAGLTKLTDLHYSFNQINKISVDAFT